MKRVLGLEQIYSSIASTEHISLQTPQSVHFVGSITYIFSPSEIAPSGQEPSQAPQDMHLSFIL